MLKYWRIDRSNLNIRKGPGTDYDRVKGYSQAKNVKAAKYKEKMEKAKSQMGEYASLTEDIDAYLKLED